MNTESIVFIVENDTVQRMLWMLLAAVNLNARIYPTYEDYLALHDSSQTQYLAMDTPFPGMQGLINRRRDASGTDLHEEKAAGFQLISVKNLHFCELSLFTKRASNAVILDSAEVNS